MHSSAKLKISPSCHPSTDRPAADRPATDRPVTCTSFKGGAVVQGGSTPVRVGPIRVGALAKRTGRSVRALRLYEEMQLLSPVSRSAAGYRLYNEEAIHRVRWIAKLQALGCSLPEIREILGEWNQSATGPEAMAKVRERFQTKLAETRKQRTALATLEGELEESLRYLELCGQCESRHTPLDACHSCERRDPSQKNGHTPSLVAGLHNT